MAEVVGLDIGASAVRAAEIEVDSGGAALVSYGQVGLPPGAIVDGEIRDESAVADALRRLWENSQFSTRYVVVGLAGLRAIIREIDLPFVPDEEVDSAVQFQSEEVIPFPVDKTILSSQVLADFQSPDGAKMRRVLVAAAHQELVEGVVRTVSAADLEVEGIDLTSSALVRALGDVSDEPEAIVSVGAGLTVVVIFEQGRPQFVRTIGTAGNAMTAAIASALDLPLADAEALKRRIGDGSAQVQAAQRAVQPIVAEVVTETRNSIQYFASQPGRHPIRRIMMTGGGSRLSGLIEQLQEQRIPVHAVSPLARLDLSRVELRPEQAAAIDPVLAAPIGLALPEPNPAVKKFNLVPPEILQQAQVRRFKSYAALGAAGLVALMGLVGGLRTYQVVSAHSGVSNLQGQIASMKTEVPRYNGPLAAANAARSSQQQLTTLTSPAVDWYNALVRLANRTPAGLEISGLTATQSGASAPSAVSSGSSSSSSASSSSTSSQCSTSGSGGSGGGASSALPPGALGALSMAVSGTYQGDPHFDPAAAWGTQVQEASAPGDPTTGGKLTAWFGQPTLTAVSNCSAGGQTTVSFSTTVPVLAPASLTNDGNFFYNG
jgi:type IV pilus assembly protein PilM